MDNSATAGNASMETPLKYNPNRCTSKKALPPSPYNASNPMTPRAGRTYDDQHRSEERMLRHAVPPSASRSDHHGILPQQLPADSPSGHKKLFTEEKFRTTTPPPSARPRRISNDAFKSTFEIFNGCGSNTTDAPTRLDPVGRRVACGVSKAPTEHYKTALDQRVRRESTRMGVGHLPPSPTTASYRVVTPYARED